MKQQMDPKWSPNLTISPTKIKMTNKAGMILKDTVMILLGPSWSFWYISLVVGY